MEPLKSIFNLFKEAGQRWSEDRASLLAAGITYYTIFSLAPLLVLVVAIASVVFTDAQTNLIGQVERTVSQQMAETLKLILDNASETGMAATVISIALSLIGASAVFTQLKRALNTVWGIEPDKDLGFLYLMQSRVLGFGMVLIIGMFLLLALALSTAISVLDRYLIVWFSNSSQLVRLLEPFVFIGLITILFAILFRVLPDAEVAWRDVWLGAAVTAVLFWLSKYLISLYVRFSSVAQVYGAAGSLIVLLLWIYFAAQVFLFGAEFTQVYANRYGSRLLPAKGRLLRDGKPYEKPAMVSLPLELLQSQETAESRPQLHTQIAIALLGLAAGLFLGFLGSLWRRDDA